MSHDDLPSASTLECIGLAVDSLEELQRLLDAVPAHELGRDGRVRFRRFHDPSGAVVQTVTRKRDLLQLTPALAAEPGSRVTAVREVEGGVVADVVDDTGQTVARMAADLLQRPVLPAGGLDGVHPASIVALGVAVRVHADPAVFAASPDSRLSDEDAPQLATESFLPHGMFGSPPVDPTAFLAGTVLDARTVRHGASGQTFHQARVRTAGFEAVCCLPVSHHPHAPPVGSVLAGTVYLVLDVPDLDRPPAR